MHPSTRRDKLTKLRYYTITPFTRLPEPHRSRVETWGWFCYGAMFGSFIAMGWMFMDLLSIVQDHS